MVSSESPVPHDTNKTAKYTNCTIVEQLKRSTPLNTSTSRLYRMAFFLNCFRDGMCSAFKTLLLMSRNAI